MPIHPAESAAEGRPTMGALALPALAKDVLQELGPKFSEDQRSGNFYFSFQQVQVNNSQGNTVASPPVPIASIVPPRLQHELRCRLNRESPVFW